jgi:phosphoadenosine phosphosulfate reductase
VLGKSTNGKGEWLCRRQAVRKNHGMNKIDKSIELIRKAEPLALRYQDYGFHLAFSGGKDSQVIYELCKMAGVKFRPVMNVTTVDPPELMKFVRKNYPNVIMERPEINFYKLIVKERGLPTQIARFCCKHLKEHSGAGTVTLVGIRKAESTKRAKRNEIEVMGKKYSGSLDQFNIDVENQVSCVNGKDKIMLSPILNWTTSEVWNFIRSRKIEYCNLYDRGYHRVGCMFCPMASVKVKQLDRKNYPGVEKAIKRSIQELINMGKYKDLSDNVDDVFNWWVSGKSAKVYLSKKLQYELDL